MKLTAEEEKQLILDAEEARDDPAVMPKPSRCALVEPDDDRLWLKGGGGGIVVRKAEGKRARSILKRYAPNAIKILTPQEAWDLFDARAQKRLGMTGDEFIRAWDAGEFKDRLCEPDWTYVAMARCRRP